MNKLWYFGNFGKQLNTDTVIAMSTSTHLSGIMSSAIILSAASANLFWSTGAAAGAAPELELGLELKLGGKGGLRDETSPLGAKVCRGRTDVFCLTF